MSTSSSASKENNLSSWLNLYFLIYFLLLCSFLWGSIVTFTKVDRIYHSWIYPLHHSSLSPCPHSTGIIFPFSYMRHNISTIFTSYTLSLCPPPPTGTNPQTGPVLPSCPLFLKRQFCLFKIANQSFIVTFPCIYVL
jgi:hypothetical protein